MTAVWQTLRAKSPLNAFALKIIMAALMLLDHLRLFLPGMPLWFHQLGRLVMPVFVFLLAQSMAHTRSRPRYLWRLYVAAGVMQAGNGVLFLLFGTGPVNNILLSLALTATAIYAIDKLKEPHDDQALLHIALLLVAIAASGFVEGRYFCLIGGLICYYLRKKPLLMSLAFVLAQGLYLLLLGRLLQTQGLMLWAAPLFLLYNGKKGPANLPPAAQYFFYVFYPVHVWVLFIIGQTCFPL